MTKFAEVLSYLQQTFNITTLIETGILGGTTTCWAAEHFDKVIGIEIEATFVKNVQKKCTTEGHSNVEIIEGDSGVKLPLMLESLEQPAIVLLDAHFPGSCTPEAIKKPIQCPLAKELGALIDSSVIHFIIIDDIGFFKNPHGLPTGTDTKQFPLYPIILSQLWPRWSIFVNPLQLVAIPKDYSDTARDWFIDNNWHEETMEKNKL